MRLALPRRRLDRRSCSSDPRQRGAAGLGAWNAIAWQDRDRRRRRSEGRRPRHRARSHQSRGVRRRTQPIALAAAAAGGSGRSTRRAGTGACAAGDDDRRARCSTRSPGARPDSRARCSRRPRVACCAPVRRARRSPQTDARRSAPCCRSPTQCDARPDAAAIRQRRRGSAGVASRRRRSTRPAATRRWPTPILNALGANPSPGRVAAALRALAPDDSGPAQSRRDRAVPATARDVPEADRTILEWPAWMNEHGRPRAVQADSISKPLVEGRRRRHRSDGRASARRRTCALDAAGHHAHRPGGDRTGTRSAAVELPLRALAGLDAARRRRSRSTAMSSGSRRIPRSSKSLLVGANHQTTAELRWRNVPLVTRWSPLRKFWQRTGEASSTSLPIKSVARQRRARQRGARAAGRDGGSGRRLSNVAVPPLPGDGRLSLSGQRATGTRPNRATTSTPRRMLPTFTGTIGTDITFFGFPVDAGSARDALGRARRTAGRLSLLPEDEGRAGSRAAPATSASNFAYPAVRAAGARADRQAASRTQP